LAYTSYCPFVGTSGVFLRTGKRTRRVAGDFSSIVLRGRSLAGIADDGNGDFSVYRIVSHGRVCPKPIRASFGAGDREWFPSRAFFSGNRIAWVMGVYGGILRAPTPAVLAAKPGGPCGRVGTTGMFDFAPETAGIESLAIDDRRLVYTDGSRVLLHRLPARPSTAPPPNDDFENATDLGSSPTQRVTGRTAHATLQAGEQPLDGNARTVWYAWRAVANETVYVKVETFGFSAGVFTGSAVGSLSRITPHPSGQFTKVSAQAGRTYRIAVASGDSGQNYEPFDLELTTEQPPLE
jgi:hypothetical protein